MHNHDSDFSNGVCFFFFCVELMHSNEIYSGGSEVFVVQLFFKVL